MLRNSTAVEGASLTDAYAELADSVSDVIDSGYNLSLSKVDKIIEDGGYDYRLSMEALINYAQSSAGFDTCYILAAYSASMEQQGTTKEDMIAKLNRVADSMFPVTYEVKQEEKIVPVSYFTYKPVTMTVITNQVQTGTINPDCVSVLLKRKCRRLSLITAPMGKAVRSSTSISVSWMRCATVGSCLTDSTSLSQLHGI